MANNISSSEETDRVVVQAAGKRFKISEFRSEINQNGVLQNNRFIAIFSMPKLLKFNYEFGGGNGSSKVYNDSDSFMTLRCDSVAVPGVNFFTNDNVRRHGIGQIEKRPYLPTFNPIKMQFIVDRNARVIKFFNDWTNNIVNYNTDMGLSPLERKQKPYLLKHRDEYISPTVRIWVYDENNLTSFGVKLYDAFPLTTSDVDLNWASQNDVIKYNVTLQFSHMSMQFVDLSGSKLDAETKALIGTTPKSRSEILTNAELESKEPDFWSTVFAQAGNIVQGEIYSGAERIVSKTFDNIFR